MAESMKTIGAGSSVLVSNDGTTYTTMGSVTNISMPSLKRDTIDITDLNSFANNDQMKETMPGYMEAEDITVEGFFLEDDAGMKLVTTAFDASSLLHVQVALPKVIKKAMFVCGYVTALKSIGEINPTDGIKYSFTLHPQKRPHMDVPKPMAGV